MCSLFQTFKPAGSPKDLAGYLLKSSNHCRAVEAAKSYQVGFPRNAHNMSGRFVLSSSKVTTFQESDKPGLAGHYFARRACASPPGLKATPRNRTTLTQNPFTVIKRKPDPLGPFKLRRAPATYMLSELAFQEINISACQKN
jgi:hypothetical protein